MTNEKHKTEALAHEAREGITAKLEQELVLLKARIAAIEETMKKLGLTR